MSPQLHSDDEASSAERGLLWDADEDRSRVNAVNASSALKPSGTDADLKIPQSSGLSPEESDEDDLEVYARNARGAPSPSFPPATGVEKPRYLDQSREHEYDADEGVLDGELDDADVPVLQGLLANARSRGSIDSTRSNGNIEDPENGLVVGRGNATLLSSIANMANSILGAGIIGLPYAVREAGFITGILLLVILGAVTDWTVRLMVVNAKLTGQKSYTDIMEACFGTAGRAAVSFFQLAFAFGGMSAFAVILGDTIPHVLSSLMPGFASTGFGSFVFSRQFVIIVCTMGFSYPLSLYRDIEKLSKASALALVSMAIIVLTVVVEGPTLDADLRGDPAKRFTFISSGFFEAVGVIAFAYVCHHNTLLIYGSLRVPTLDNWNKVAHASTGLSVLASLVMAISGYSIFTDKTRGNILNNFPSDHFWANLARFCFGLNMMTTTPLEAFVCREVIELYFFRDQPYDQKRHFIITTGLIVTSMSISLLVCDLGIVLELVGGFAATSLAFILPAACSLKLSSDPYTLARWPAWACMSFGMVVCVLATTFSLLKEHPHKTC